MKNYMFLMLVLLHITSQPAQRSISFDPLVVLGAIGIASVVGFKVFSKLCTNFKKKERRIPKWHYFNSEARMAKKFGLDIDSYGRYGLSAIMSMVDEGDRKIDSSDKQRIVHTGDLHEYGITAMQRRLYASDLLQEHSITVIQRTVFTGELQMMRLFMDNGANGQPIHGQPPRRAKRDGDIDSPDQYGMTRMHQMIRADDPSMMGALLESGVSINYRDERGFTFLHYAFCSGTPKSKVWRILYIMGLM